MGLGLCSAVYGLWLSSLAWVEPSRPTLGNSQIFQNRVSGVGFVGWGPCSEQAGQTQLSCLGVSSPGSRASPGYLRPWVRQTSTLPNSLVTLPHPARKTLCLNSTKLSEGLVCGSSVYNNPAWVLWWQSVQTCCGERGLCLDIYSCCFEEFFLTWQIRQSRQTPGSRAMDYFSLHYPPWAECLTWGSCLIPVFWTSDCWVDCALSLW